MEKSPESQSEFDKSLNLSLKASEVCYCYQNYFTGYDEFYW